MISHVGKPRIVACSNWLIFTLHICPPVQYSKNQTFVWNGFVVHRSGRGQSLPADDDAVPLTSCFRSRCFVWLWPVPSTVWRQLLLWSWLQLHGFQCLLRLLNSSCHVSLWHMAVLIQLDQGYKILRQNVETPPGYKTPTWFPECCIPQKPHCPYLFASSQVIADERV